MKHILFVCVENAGRSQMAQAFAKMAAGDEVKAYSAGSRPSGKINPKAIQVMKEAGYDLTAHSSKSLKEIPDIEYDAVITIGCGDECPFVRAKRRVDWNIPDPKDSSLDEVRRIRDLIGAKVREVLSEIG